jgi:hypothetical protein
VLQIRLLLCASKALSTGSLIFVTAVIIALVCKSSRMFGLLLRDSLSLGLLVCSSFSICYGFSVCGSFGLFSFYLRVLSRIPRLKNIAILLFVIELASADSSGYWWR